jgi:hypothetical protein
MRPLGSTTFLGDLSAPRPRRKTYPVAYSRSPVGGIWTIGRLSGPGPGWRISGRSSRQSWWAGSEEEA